MADAATPGAAVARRDGGRSGRRRWRRWRRVKLTGGEEKVEMEKGKAEGERRKVEMVLEAERRGTGGGGAFSAGRQRCVNPPSPASRKVGQGACAVPDVYIRTYGAAVTNWPELHGGPRSAGDGGGDI